MKINIFKMDFQIMYKFMSNYRQIVHLSKINVCKLMQDSNANIFFKQPLLQIRSDFPNADLKCPIKVNTYNNIFYVI